MDSIHYDELAEYQQGLLDAAAGAMDRSYSPYSKFRVGAAILSDNNQTIIGANVENAAFSSTICAERAAIVSANAQGVRNFRAIAVIAKSENGPTKTPTAPCGECRQVLAEFATLAGHDIEVILSNTDKSNIVVTSVKALLPLGFGPDDLA